MFFQSKKPGFLQASDLFLQEGLELNVGIFQEAVVKAAWVMVLDAVLIQWIGVLAADFPDEWVEVILEAFLAHLPQLQDFIC